MFTLGVLCRGAFPVVAAHAALSYPTGHLPARTDRWAITIGYVVLFGIFGLAPAIVFDPVAGGCQACPANLLQIGTASTIVEALRHGGAACAAVMTALFRHDHAELVTAPTLLSVRAKGATAQVVLGSRAMPASLVYLQRQGGSWYVQALIGSPLP